MCPVPYKETLPKPEPSANQDRASLYTVTPSRAKVFTRRQLAISGTQEILWVEISSNSKRLKELHRRTETIKCFEKQKTKLKVLDLVVTKSSQQEKSQTGLRGLKEHVKHSCIRDTIGRVRAAGMMERDLGRGLGKGLTEQTESLKPNDKEDRESTWLGGKHL